MDIRYRWMEAGDAAALSALAHRIWHAHYPGIISAGQIAYMLEKSYTPEELIRQHEAGNRFLLAEMDGVMAGFASIGPLAAVANPLIRGDGIMEGAYFLHKFYLIPGFRDKGSAALCWPRFTRNLVMWRDCGYR